MTFSEALQEMKRSAARSNEAARAAGWFPAHTPRDTVGQAKRMKAHKRRQRVAALRACGYSVKKIARDLGCSLNTVKSDLSFNRAAL